MKGEKGPKEQHHLCSMCAICLEHVLDISPAAAGDSWKALAAPDHDHSGHTFERTGLLPCGHLIGRDCRKQQGEKLEQCPICRQSAACGKCNLPLLLECVWGGGDTPLTVRPDAPLPAVDARTGRSKNIYCRQCMVRQAVLLLHNAFVGNEECLLCREDTFFPPRPLESAAAHRARRRQAADLHLRERLQMVCRLVLPSVPTKWSGRDDLEQFWRPSRDEFPEAVLEQEKDNWAFLRPRIFGNCRITGDRVGPLSRYVPALVQAGLLISTVAKATVQMGLAWYPDVDDLMAIDTSQPAPLNRAMFAMFMDDNIAI
ncbi:hypothetical protein PG991_012369 [Apiospora marii]|uniref:RING-type domain-containing protein n=1 Tax=Apiospora marii TaxID=335849 RepID=A0ABR1RA08_9PEZI